MKKSNLISVLFLCTAGFFTTQAQTPWFIVGNAGTVDGVHFLGTLDSRPLNFRVNNQPSGRIDHVLNNSFFGYRAGTSTSGNDNTSIGTSALTNNTTGRYNTALGSNALFTNNTANNNTALGFQSLYNNDASDNSAFGFQSLYTNNIGSYNTASGTKALYNNTEGSYNTASGMEALYTNNIASNNTANGYRSLYLNTGDNNTGVGSLALYNNTGNGNTAHGVEALYTNTSGYENTAVGVVSLYENTSGHDNSAMGAYTLEKNTTGSFNTGYGNKALNRNVGGLHGTATGYASLYNNQSGNENTANGAYALFSNISGTRNSAVGYKALYLNTGNENTSLGNESLRDNSSGSYNTAVGYQALVSNGVGTTNSAMGYKSLFSNTNGYNNTANGYMALSVNTTGFGNTVLGANANVSASNLNNATAIGSGALVNASNKVVIGSNTAGMVIGGYANWSNLSDGRFKENVKENVPGLEFITKLRPVTYTINRKKLDEHLMQNIPDSIKAKSMQTTEKYSLDAQYIQTGFIAQEVEKTAKELGYNFDGVNTPKNPTDNYSIAYSQFVVPIIKAVQEQQEIIEGLNAKIAALENKSSIQSGIEENSNIFKNIVLEQNIPNPFNESATIRYFIPKSVQAPVSLIICDLQGKQIKRINNLEKEINSTIEINANELYKGIFIYSLISEGKEIANKKMIVE
jgi:trimeric autotransporter adhesin